jgi:hypothetical protein
MATTRNILMQKTSGHIDKQIVFKTYGDRTVISGYPDMSKVKRSPEQRRMNDLMEAANYATKEIMNDDKLRMEAQVRLNVTSNKLYTSLIREYFQLHKDDKDPLFRPGVYRNPDPKAKEIIRKYKKLNRKK